MRYTAIGVCVGAMVVLGGAVWMRFEDARPWHDAAGKPNKSLLGPSFGSVGQDGIVGFDGVVDEVKPNGFVVIGAGEDSPPMLIGAINPIDGVADLKKGDTVRIEVRRYLMERGDDRGSKKIFVVTKRLEK